MSNPKKEVRLYLILSRRRPIRLCVNTQTPPIRFKLDYPDLVEKYGTISDEVSGAHQLGTFKEGIDYDFTPGGVTSMVYPAIKRMKEIQLIDRAQWVSLGPSGPGEVAISDEILLHNVWMNPETLALYANFKEGIWNEIHGLGKLSFKPREYEAYVSYNWKCAQIMLQMMGDIDLFWVHDFQQLHIGNLIGPSAPAILRWHIPFNLGQVSERLRTLILKSIEGFDAMIVSTKRDLQGLIHAGYRGKAYAIYPYLDMVSWGGSGSNSQQSSSTMDNLRSRLKLGRNDIVLCVIGRMDPVKSQDIALKAVARLRNFFHHLKLVFVGNGSFTGSSQGGIGHPKASLWRSHLEQVTRDLKVEDMVVFAGHLSHKELDAIYSLCDIVLVPSRIEGFNLTAVEGWLHKKPCIVSRGAGVSELIHDEVNGLTFEPSNDTDLAEKIEKMLQTSEAAVSMGEIGFRTASLCSVDRTVESLNQIFEEVMKGYSVQHVPNP
ncbi:MAG TPA: glycosyltransferase [Nitrososphaerales archaeon]|nr:glycosyltransferase [Nitrososphaerales archaeon]